GFRDQMTSPLLLDMAIHTFDAARYLSQADPVSVYCEEFNPAWSWYQGNASASAIFELSGGLQYTYRGSRCAEGVPTSWASEARGREILRATPLALRQHHDEARFVDADDAALEQCADRALESFLAEAEEAADLVRARAVTDSERARRQALEHLLRVSRDFFVG